MTTTSGNDWVSTVGRPAYESLRDMVAAADVDWERLEELRDDRDRADSPEAWAAESPEDAEELAELEELVGDCADCADRDDAETRIAEDPLSVEFRSGWCTSPDDFEPEEFCVLLTTGGPAVRIIGELDRGEPTSALLEVQDWGKPWTEYIPRDESGTVCPGWRDVLVSYCRRVVCVG